MGVFTVGEPRLQRKIYKPSGIACATGFDALVSSINARRVIRVSEFTLPSAKNSRLPDAKLPEMIRAFHARSVKIVLYSYDAQIRLKPCA